MTKQQHNPMTAAASACASAASFSCANIAIILTGIALAVSVLLFVLSLPAAAVSALILPLLVFAPSEASKRFRT